MRIAYRKVWRDLMSNKGRTLLVVFSIAVGVTAIGMISSSRGLLKERMIASQIASQPSHGQIYLDRGIDDETVLSLTRLPEISQIEGTVESSLRWKPTLEAEWEQRSASVIARNDYENQLYDIVTLLSGNWPDSKSTDIEFNHHEPYNVPALGDDVYFEVNERPFAMTVGGTVRDPAQFPPPNAQSPAFYVTRDMMERLASTRDFTTLHFTIPEYSEDQAEIAVDVVKTRLKKLGVTVTSHEIQDPERHPMQDIIVDGVAAILAGMAFMSLFLSVFLVFNTVSAVIAQQVPQIGVMKTIGGMQGDISRLYFAGVGIYGLLSLLISVPLGAMGGYNLLKWLLFLLNVPLGQFEFQWVSLLYQVAAGLFAPLVAAFFPVLQGARITVREAISSYGLGSGQYGTRWIDRMLGQIRGLPRLAALPLRNTFRSVRRVFLTELTLIVAGAVFLTVLSMGTSVEKTMASAWDAFGFDIVLTFSGNQRISEVLPEIESRPYVERAEMWVWRNVKARVPGTSGPGTEFDMSTRAMPSDTQFFNPNISAGQNLDSTSDRILLLNEELAKDMGLEVGEEILLDLGEERESIWTISGLVVDFTRAGETAYLYRDVLNEELNQVGRASVGEIKLKSDAGTTLDEHKIIIDDLEDHFTTLGIEIGAASSFLQEREQASAQLNILVTVLMIMAVLVALVGSIGLSGTLSINVIERIKEIGVMRAVGASSMDVGLIFIGEGMILGLLSWLLAIPISVVFAWFFVDALGGIVDINFRFFYSYSGILLWLFIVLVLSLLASWLPAMHATRISVARSLAYE